MTNLGYPADRSASIDYEQALEVLDRYGLALQQCDQVQEQIRLSLDAVRDSLNAEVVLWYPGSAQSGMSLDFPIQVGTPELPATWAEDFLRYVRMGNPRIDRLVENFLDPSLANQSPWPTSAAMVRVSKSRDSWVMAFSFHPRKLFTSLDLKLLMLARRLLLNHRQQSQVYEKLRDSLFGLVRCLTAAIDAKDPYTWGHSERVARIALRIGNQMSLSSAMLSDLYLAGLLHDIGKIGIRDSVLQKPGRLTEEEYEHIKLHAIIGYRLVSNIRPLHHLCPAVRNHHEHWDGNGYPDGLAGETIPLQARILAVADSCDAMMAARPYRSGMPPGRIDEIMAQGSGTQWDPTIVEFFMKCRHDLYPICQRGLGDSVFVAVEQALQVVKGTGEDSSKLALA